MPNLRLCSVSGCDKPMRARGLCGLHYQRHRTSGELIITKIDTAKSFIREVAIPYSGDDCLIWPFARTNGGYALVQYDGKHTTASRAVCSAVRGPAPSPQHEAAHSCGNGKRGCITPKHLSWKTRTENEKDKELHNSMARGERQGLSKLTEAQVLEIRALEGKMTKAAIARQFNISRATASRIIEQRMWGWLDAPKDLADRS